MEAKAVLELFSRYDAYLEGHFRLTSGLHSPHYFQCARVLQHPEAAEKLGQALGAQVKKALGGALPDAVLSPAMGGLIIGHELGRYFRCRAIFVERQDGVMTLRRFNLSPGEKVVVVEDVVTTGGSLSEAVQVARSLGANVLGIACLVDRTGGAHLEMGLTSLVKANVVTYPPDNCPLCREGLPLVKPGSRNV
ncbi:orotate phosphoribosyltransferase [bacterium]|nr:orotate phosphoribosyltransferase [bacterium]